MSRAHARAHAPAACRRRRGLTLIEFVIALAVLAVLGSLALPMLGQQLSRQRLVSAAELLAADIADARQEAARRGGALQLQSSTGSHWCWAVTTTPDCPCQAAAACRLKAAGADDHPGISLIAGQSLQFEADGQAQAAVAAVFAAGVDRVQVEVTRFGRARVCDPVGAISKLPRC